MNTKSIALLGILTLASCGQQGSKESGETASAVQTGMIVKSYQEGDWAIKERISRGGEVAYKEESLPVELANEWARKEYKNTTLSQVTVNPKFNAQLFRIDGKDTKNAVFIAPKIYSFSGSEVARMQPLMNEDDGTMTLFFPIMLIDGLSATVPSPDSPHESIRIPDNMLVKDLAGLNDFISKKYAADGEQNLARLSGCPKEIIMTIAGRQFNIASDILRSSDYCDYNVPIMTSIKLRQKEALWLLQQGLYSGAAQVTAIFETRVPYTVSKFSIEMNKSKLYEEIAAKLKYKSLVAEVEAKLEMTKIVKQQAMKISIQGDMNAHLDSIVNQAIDQFFERMPADPAKADMNCGNAKFCLKLSYTRQTYEENLSVEWTQTSNVLSGQNITTWARLFPLADANVRFDDLKTNGTPRSTELVLMKDDLLELKISNISEERFSQGKSTSIAHNNVVVDTKVERSCTESEGGDPEHHTGGHHDRCTTTRTPIYADQWIEETIYSAVPQKNTFDNPIGKMDVITDEIMFGFSWFENGKLKTVECPANSFEREGDGRTLLLRINNVPGCEIFTKNSTNKPKLYLINKGPSSKVEITEGKTTKNWKGQTTSSVRNAVYQSKSSYAGEISIRGYKIGNSLESSFGAGVK